METSSNISRQSPEEGTVTLPFGAQVEMNERATSRHDSVTMEKQLLPPTLKEPVRAVSPIGKHPQPRVPTPPTRNPETEPKPSPMLSNRASPNLGSSILKTRSTPVSFTGSSTDSLKTAGSMWITRYHDKYWPVVLCNEATVPPTFMKSRRETSHLPAILLGKRIYIWTIGKDLRAYDHLRDYLSGSKKFKIDDVLSDDEEEDVTEKKWQRAFRVDALMGKDHNYWTNAIKQERAQRKIRDLMRVQKRRRSNSGRQNPRAPKRRGDDEYARSKRIHRLEADVDEGRADDRIATYRNDQNAEQEAIQADYRQTIENQPGICTVTVASETGTRSFQIPNSAFSRCLVLEPLRRPAVPQPQTNHQSPDTFINLSEHFDIGPEDFRPVATYLHKGSFSPETKTTRDGKIVVEGVVTEADADNAAQRFAQAYHTASLLQMGPLLQQCVEKLRRLPLVGPLALIIVTTYFGRAQQYACAATAGMEEWLVSCISGSFWRLIKENGMRFGRIMEDMPHLRMRVLDRMAAMRRRGEDEEDGEDGEDEEDGEDSGSRSDQY